MKKLKLVTGKFTQSVRRLGTKFNEFEDSGRKEGKQREGGEKDYSDC